jgi:hypothetical protein
VAVGARQWVRTRWVGAWQWVGAQRGGSGWVRMRQWVRSSGCVRTRQVGEDAAVGDNVGATRPSLRWVGDVSGCCGRGGGVGDVSD